MFKEIRLKIYVVMRDTKHPFKFKYVLYLRMKPFVLYIHIKLERRMKIIRFYFWNSAVLT